VAGNVLILTSLCLSLVFNFFLALFLHPLVLETELEKLRHWVGQIVEYVRAHGSFSVGCLDNISCRIRDIMDFSVHRGVGVALVVKDLRSGCCL
jgi:hypothetical protein